MIIEIIFHYLVISVLEKPSFAAVCSGNCSKNYDPNTKTRILVLITLREQKGIRLPQMISGIMNEMGLKNIDYPAFTTLNRMGMFVILIDGFDEMATHASFEEMLDNFRELAELAEEKSKVMLTCRTHYFSHKKEQEDVLSLPEFNELPRSKLTRYHKNKSNCCLCNRL